MISLALIFAMGCPKPAPVPQVVEAPAFDRSKVPEPLARKYFQVPLAQTGTLSNGLDVMVVENHEIPTVSMRLVLNTGSWTDPVDREGLAGASMAMLKEGAGDYDTQQLSSALRKLGSSVSSGSGLDSANVSMSCLKSQLEPTLDLWATVLLEPTWPADEWERLRNQFLQDIEAGRTNPNQMAWTVFDRVLYGDRYDGRKRSAESLGAVDVTQMEAWYGAHVLPANAVLLVGGDTTLAELQPLLEARLSGWTNTGDPVELPKVEGSQPEETVIYLVDKPGAAQSVIAAGRFTGDELDDDYPHLYVGNAAWGGQFTARLNMNLREDKGYTYGARSGVFDSMAPTTWYASASVKSDTTAASLTEIFNELADVQADRPLTAEEIAYVKSGLLNGYPAKFETADYLLSELGKVWRLDRPENWLSTWMEKLEGVSADQAQAAFVSKVASQPMAVVVVGDLASIQEPVTALGKPIVVMDVDGNLLSDSREQ